VGKKERHECEMGTILGENQWEEYGKKEMVGR
jgi:hypothetical protein